MSLQTHQRPSSGNWRWLITASVTLLAAMPSLRLAHAAGTWDCGDPFVNHFGPFDYRVATAHDKKLVEGAHFTPGVESLTKPSKTMYTHMAQDVAYTLHVFPNHPRALNAMVRLGERYKMDTPYGASFTVECYFDRAVRFRPDDTVVRSLYAVFLGKQKRTADAAKQLAIATEFAKDNPLTHFNIGLVYFDIGNYEQALAAAHRARAGGYTRPELEERLKGVGKWVEPTTN